MKKETSIEDFIRELGVEIKKTKASSGLALSLDRLKEIAQKYHGEDEVISSLELVEKIKNRPEEPRIMSGWTGLDEILKGFRLKQLITLAAATKSGKTSFALDLTQRIKNLNPLWFPFEEGAEELITKCLERGEESPLFYTPETITGNTLLWLEKKIIESIAKYDTKVIFIDHLHFIVPFSVERQDLAIGQTMRELKQIAKKWDICIFLIAHFKKTKMETQPDLDDLRDSSFIAQESDTVIMLWRENTRESGQVVITNNVNVSVQANRRTGKTGNVKMVFDNGHFVEKEWRSRAEEEAEVKRAFNNYWWRALATIHVERKQNYFSYRFLRLATVFTNRVKMKV